MKVLIRSLRIQRRAVTAALYLKIWMSLCVVRVRLSVRGYQAFEHAPVTVSKTKEEVSPPYIARIVERVSRYVPGALCLAQAVTAQRLLAKMGFKTTMRVGVKSDDHDHLEAHAWLLYQGKVIMGGGGEDLGEFRVMTDMKSATRS
ncbi:MAG: lasso peptide biosynthesis B2 protein [Pseudomonadota bacterium]